MRVIGILLINLAILTACVSDSDLTLAGQDEPVNVRAIVDPPVWFSNPPSEEGYIYGIGCDENIDKAKSKSIVNAGQQFSTRVNTVLVDKTVTAGGETVPSLYKIDRNLTSGVVKGAKYYDQFQDSRGDWWVLSRAPMNCALDVAESVILSYVLEMKQEGASLTLDYSRDFTALLMEEVEKEVAQTGSDYLEEIQKSRTVNLSPAVISVDGRIDDWAPMEPVLMDSTGDNRDGQVGIDLQNLYLAHDGENLYLRLDVADGRLSANNLAMVVQLKTADNSWNRLLFSINNDGWQTGIDRWTDKSSGYHEQLSSGKIRVRNGVLEASYSLEDLGLPVNKAILVDAWNDMPGISIDHINESPLIYSEKDEYLAFTGVMYGERIYGSDSEIETRRFVRDEAPLAGETGYNNTAFYIDREGNRKMVSLDIVPSVLSLGKNNCPLINNNDSRYGIIIASDVTQEHEGYLGNYAGGTITVYYYDSERIMGSFDLITNHEQISLEGIFNIKL